MPSDPPHAFAKYIPGFLFRTNGPPPAISEISNLALCFRLCETWLQEKAKPSSGPLHQGRGESMRPRTFIMILAACVLAVAFGSGAQAQTYGIGTMQPGTLSHT